MDTLALQSLVIALIRFLDLYFYVLLARIILSWFPNIDWYRQPAKLLDDLTEPVMRPFRRLIPPLGGFDFSPMVLFLVIQLLKSFLASLLGGF